MPSGAVGAVARAVQDGVTSQSTTEAPAQMHVVPLMAHRETDNEGQASQGLGNASSQDVKEPIFPRNRTEEEDLASWKKKRCSPCFFGE